MTELKGLLFDKDGTLFDFQKTWAPFMAEIIETVAEGDTARAALMAEALGFDPAALRFDPSSVVVAGTNDDILDRLQSVFPDLDRDDTRRRMTEGSAEVPQVPATDLSGCFSELTAMGFVLGIATNDAETAALANLESAGVLPFFDFVAGYDSGYGGKPAPGQLLAFARVTGLAPGAVAMIGDSTHDLHAGQAAGMLRIGVLTGTASETDLAPHADVVLPDIGALPGWLADRG